MDKSRIMILKLYIIDKNKLNAFSKEHLYLGGLGGFSYLQGT